VGKRRADLGRRGLSGLGLDERRSAQGYVANALVVHLEGNQLAQLLGVPPAEAHAGAGLARAKTAFVGKVPLAAEDIESQREIALEEIGFGEADVSADRALRDEETRAEVLAAAQKVLLADAD